MSRSHRAPEFSKQGIVPHTFATAMDGVSFCWKRRVSMGKYTPLERHLRRCKAPSIELSFADMERLIGAMLPNSAQNAEWWSNGASLDRRQVQREAWRAAGFSATLIAGKDRVRFTRLIISTSD